jgi:hypothetical protein
VITDLDQTLKTLLERRIPLDPGAVEISFACPTRAWASALRAPAINLYLFDVRENAELRVVQMFTENRSDRPSGRRIPPVHLDISYIITAWAPDVEAEHRLLWQTLVALLREPVIGEDVLVGTLREAGPPTRTHTAQAEGMITDMPAFWAALGNELRPSVTYTATMLADLDLLIEAPLVKTREIGISDLQVGHRREGIAIGGVVRSKPKRGAQTEPIEGAQVTFPRLGITVRSGADGRFLVPDIPRGRHRVRVAVGSRAIESEMEVPAPSYDLEV